MLEVDQKENVKYKFRKCQFKLTRYQSRSSLFYNWQYVTKKKKTIIFVHKI